MPGALLDMEEPAKRALVEIPGHNAATAALLAEPVGKEWAVAGHWRDLYRAIDRDGNLLDSMLPEPALNRGPSATYS